MSVLLDLVLSGDLEKIKLLSPSKQEIDSRPEEYVSPVLILACRNNKVEIVQYLLANGADVNIENRYGETPILAASSTGNLKLIRLLMGEGADLRAKSMSGLTIKRYLEIKLQINLQEAKKSQLPKFIQSKRKHNQLIADFISTQNL